MIAPKKVSIFLVFCIWLLSAPALAEGIPCWIRCHRPPKIQSTKNLACALRRRANKKLRFIDRSSGILTTYLFKLMGIQGWKDYGEKAYVRGVVMHANGSDDGLYTIDIRIQSMLLDGKPVALDGTRFIRAEVFPLVRIGAPLPLGESEEVCIGGKLMWDGDGFLEIHPKHSMEIRARRDCQQ